MNFLELLEGLRTPFFDRVFQFVTFFGEETLFMIIAMTFFWCIDKKTGYFLLYISFLGNMINQFFKLLFLIPRPWVIDPDFTIVESARAGATGYSFPSGHTQNAAGLFLGVARARKEILIGIVCVVITLLVGFSRMYLGVHTPADVLTSIGVSVLLVMAAYPVFLRAWKKKAWFIPLIAVLLGVAAALVLYLELAPVPARAIAQFSAECAETSYKMVGGAIGFTLVLWLEQRYIKFSEKAVWWAQILKVVLGLSVVLAVRLLLKAPLLSLFGGHYAADAVRYFLMVIVGGAIWPMTFLFFGRLGRKKEQAL